MARKKRQDFTPDPECEAAFGRVVDTAHLCAATLFGEPRVDDPAKDASLRALLMAMGMVYFLLRIAPDDLRALLSQGGFGALDWKPFPPDYAVHPNGPFADYLAGN